jgi:uncharacterized protein YcfJ
MNERLPKRAYGIQWLQAMMTHRSARRTAEEAVGMNRNATAFLVLLLASGITLATWELGWNGPRYARVLKATPVTVREPRYADVVESVPVDSTNSADGPKRWDVTYKEGSKRRHVRTATEPGDQIRVGEQRRVIGYDVVWRWRDHTGVVRMARHPGERLPVAAGKVVQNRRPTPLSG